MSMEIDGKPTRAWVPIADMANHRNPRQVTWDYDNKK